MSDVEIKGIDGKVIVSREGLDSPRTEAAKFDLSIESDKGPSAAVYLTEEQAAKVAQALMEADRG